MTERDSFVELWNELADRVWEISKMHGFCERDENLDKWVDGTDIALMHSELSEALESIRHGNPPSDHIPEFSGGEEEFADVVIRIMHFAARRKYRVAEAILAKMEFNYARPFQHGGKKF